MNKVNCNLKYKQILQVTKVSWNWKMLTNDYNIKFPKDKNDNQGRDKNPSVAI